MLHSIGQEFGHALAIARNMKTMLEREVAVAYGLYLSQELKDKYLVEVTSAIQGEVDKIIGVENLGYAGVRIFGEAENLIIGMRAAMGSVARTEDFKQLFIEEPTSTFGEHMYGYGKYSYEDNTGYYTVELAHAGLPSLSAGHYRSICRRYGKDPVVDTIWSSRVALSQVVVEEAALRARLTQRA